MARPHSYVITKSNYKTESEAVAYLLKCDERLISPDKEGRKRIMEALGLEKSFSRAFDLVMVDGHTNKESSIVFSDPSAITLVELKTTRKPLAKNPSGFFFGATKNEFDLAERMGDRFKFCFVSLHPETCSHALLTLDELKKLIRTQRIQYQINL